jgi:hypothetical protein
MNKIHPEKQVFDGKFIISTINLMDYQRHASKFAGCRSCMQSSEKHSRGGQCTTNVSNVTNSRAHNRVDSPSLLWDTIN